MAILTTHNLKAAPKVDPQPLNQITTAIIPNAVPQPAPVGDGFAKLITTMTSRGLRLTDEPPAAPGTDFTRDVDDMGKDKVDVVVGKPFDAKRAIDNLTIDLRHEPETKPAPVVPDKAGKVETKADTKPAPVVKKKFGRKAKKG